MAEFNQESTDFEMITIVTNCPVYFVVINIVEFF